VTLHARSRDRADSARAAQPTVEHVLVGDVSTIEVTRSVAGQANATGRFDAVIHNVRQEAHPAAASAEVQERLLEACADLTGTELASAM
jgi:hypothetical protein